MPESTLQDRISGRVPFGAKSGPPKYLSDEEEAELVSGFVAVGYARKSYLWFKMSLLQKATKRLLLPMDGGLHSNGYIEV